jgi:DNA-binding MarR family transcriptional regulator
VSKAPPESGPAVPSAVADTPAGARLVYLALATADGGLTQAGIRERTALSQTAAHDALVTLEAAGVVRSRRHYEDLRQRVYVLVDD